ncbi:hypothetical protein HPB50_026188 [Hyalomma asiaticum]|uniref:Uncharacterized protein n=1 Tax=Hyalomma asiaticum TaxID=266040 RepID=A0ACB7RQW3_HYAAI|nr:hypothetical protein HPB50_026188 [Hyalomma asiaticum]
MRYCAYRSSTYYVEDRITLRVRKLSSRAALAADNNETRKTIRARGWLSVDEGARRKRLLYAGLLAAGTLAVTAMIIAGFASSAGSVERGAVGATSAYA